MRINCRLNDKVVTSDKHPEDDRQCEPVLASGM